MRKDVRIDDDTIFVHQTGKSPYSEIGPCFERVLTCLKKIGMNDKIDTVGMYYDDPKTTDTPRYDYGFFIQNHHHTNNKTAPTHKNICLNTEQESVLKNDGWKFIHLKKTDTIVSYFPSYIVPLSCIISAMKTYPAFQRHSEKFNITLKCGSVEIYRKQFIETHFPQENVEQFQPKCD